jgi:hypothetical protein
MTTGTLDAHTLHEPLGVKTPKKAALASWIGSALEYYDFFIYGTGAALVFSKIFFPASHPATGLLLALATFGVGYVARPVGAEYLAAAWLAKKVQAGFPIGRVRALIGIGGCPASELRGIHAWLPVFLPEYADLLIEADPFGVLTYVDAASLEPSRRKLLLEALARLATVGPWFRTNNWSARGLALLLAPIWSSHSERFFAAILRIST